MHSAVYHGLVCHRRLGDVPHAFRYRMFMMYLDLAELDDVFRGRWLWSVRRPALARFRRRDYLGDPATPLDEAVRDRVEASTGVRPTGPIRMLTHLRYFGYVFNPVTFYYCFAPNGDTIEAIIAEITNTPWKERHAYVLPASASRRTSESTDELRFRFPKAFHVSPFLDMSIDYDWQFGVPDTKLAVNMACFERNERSFDVSLSLSRREISSWSLNTALVRHPFMTVRVVAGIYFQAFRLWWKKAPFFVHPARREGHERLSTDG